MKLFSPVPISLDPAVLAVIPIALTVDEVMADLDPGLLIAARRAADVAVDR